MNKVEGYFRYRIEDHYKRYSPATDIFIPYLTGMTQIGLLITQTRIFRLKR